MTAFAEVGFQYLVSKRSHDTAIRANELDTVGLQTRRELRVLRSVTPPRPHSINTLGCGNEVWMRQGGNEGGQPAWLRAPRWVATRTAGMGLNKKGRERWQVFYLLHSNGDDKINVGIVVLVPACRDLDVRCGQNRSQGLHTVHNWTIVEVGAQGATTI